MAALASDWLRHFGLLVWNRWTEFNKTWQEARSQRPLPSLCFSGRWEKQDGRPGLWLAETISTSPLKPLNGIQRNLTGSKISTPSTKFVFFGADRKIKMAAPASDWLRHFRLLLWNGWTEFNETWQEARSQCPLDRHIDARQSYLYILLCWMLINPQLPRLKLMTDRANNNVFLIYYWSRSCSAQCKPDLQINLKKYICIHCRDLDQSHSTVKSRSHQIGTHIIQKWLS